jgi:integrase
MKIKKISVDEIKQITLDSYRKLASPDMIYQIKEKSRGRGQGVFVARFLNNKDIDFYFVYFIEGKEKLKKIGRYGSIQGQLTLAQARAEFRKLSSIYSSGIDPKVQEQEYAQKLAEEKRIQNEIEKRKKMQGSSGQLSEFFLDHLEKNRSGKHFRDVRSAFNNNLPTIDLSKKACDITKTDIKQILHRIVERGSEIMANRMRSYLSAMFEYGIRFDDSVESVERGINFFIETNPVSPIQKIVQNEKRGERSLTEKEVKIFWRALDKSNMSVSRINAFKLILLTGSRVGEIAGLRWDEIDCIGKTIELPSTRTKNKRELIIPMNDEILRIINSTPKLNEIYVFAAENNLESLKPDGFSQAITRLMKNTEIDKFVPRDLRRTFKTLTGKAGISKEIRDRLQNHSLQDVSSQHYDKYNYLKEKQQAMAIWNDFFVNNILNDEIN